MDTGLRYACDSRRWCLGATELHGGYGLQVMGGGRWLPVRIEYDNRHGWLFYADHERVCILPSSAIPARQNA